MARQLGVWLTSGCRQCTTARDADGTTRCNLRRTNRLLVPGRKRRELLLGELGYKVAVLRLQLVESDDRTLLAEAEEAAVLDGHTLDLAVRVFEDRVYLGDLLAVGVVDVHVPRPCRRKRSTPGPSWRRPRTS